MANNPDVEKILQAGLDLPADRKIYFNGFVVSVTGPDVILVLQNNNQPVAALNVSHIIAKTLVTNLQDLLQNFERDTKTNIMTLGDIAAKIQERDNAINSGNANKD